LDKNHHHLWEEITSFQNSLKAYHKAAVGRRSRATVAEFERNLEVNIPTLQTELLDGSYEPGTTTRIT
jgi:hypothetical protein